MDTAAPAASTQATWIRQPNPYQHRLSARSTSLNFDLRCILSLGTIPPLAWTGLTFDLPASHGASLDPSRCSLRSWLLFALKMVVVCPALLPGAFLARLTHFPLCWCKRTGLRPAHSCGGCAAPESKKPAALSDADLLPFVSDAGSFLGPLPDSARDQFAVPSGQPFRLRLQMASAGCGPWLLRPGLPRSLFSPVRLPAAL